MKNTDLKMKTDLSESAWIESESLRLLMETRSRTNGFSAFTMLAVAALFYGHVNLLLIAAWLIASLAVLALRLYIKSQFNKLVSNAYVGSQTIFVERNKFVWTLSGLTWGLAGWLNFTNIPTQNQYIGATILAFVGFVAIHNLYARRAISRDFINAFMGVQVFGAFWVIAYVGQFRGPQIQYIHVLCLLAIWPVLHIFSKRLYSVFTRNLLLQFRNNSLIKSLNLKTEQLVQEKQIAMNANEVLQRFYASAVHDIRQPVDALKAYVKTAEGDETQWPDLLPKMTASCSSINKLLTSLYDFEQINSGHINVAHQTVDIDDVVDHLKQQFKPLALRKNLEFRTNAIAGYVQTDELLIKRILTCFVSNAVRYTEKGGILLAVRKSKLGIDFEVWDTGIGIDVEHQTRVFEEFYKVGDLTSTDEGFGLGLSAVKKLSAYAENSSIGMQSRLGRGSVFRFTLPLSVYLPPYVQAKNESASAFPIQLDLDLSQL
jgi:two-component system, sensor histidine kinase